MALTDKLTSIADAIRQKENSTATMTLAEMPAKILALSGGGSDVDIAGFIEGTSADDVAKAGQQATKIRSYAFSSCSSLTTADFPKATSISNYAFQSCSALTTANFPKATSIGSYAFYYCYKLTTVDFPAATSMGSYAFSYCTNLTAADFPATTSISTYAFSNCASLTTADFPKATSIGTYVFNYCTRLIEADFPVVTSISAYAFRACSSLTALILRNTAKVCTLSNTNAFTSSAIASGTGYIYVPSALVDSYKAATNWSTYANQFRALEDYTVDGTTTGALDPTKTGVAS